MEMYGHTLSFSDERTDYDGIRLSRTTSGPSWKPRMYAFPWFVRSFHKLKQMYPNACCKCNKATRFYAQVTNEYSICC